MRFLYFALFCLALLPVRSFSQNPAPYGIQAAPKPKIVPVASAIVKPEKGRFGFIYIGEADGNYLVARIRNKKEAVVILPFSPIPKEFDFLYDIDVYDKKFKLIRTFPINFKTERPLRETFSIISNTLHIVYTAQLKNKNLILYKDVYTVDGTKLVDGEILDELDTDGKNTERGTVFTPFVLVNIIMSFAAKKDLGLEDGRFYWQFTPSQEKLLLYKQDLTSKKIVFRLSNYDTKSNFWTYSLDLGTIMEKASINNVQVNNEGLVFLEITGKCNEDNKKVECVKYYFLNGFTKQLTEIDFGVPKTELVYDTEVIVNDENNFILTCLTQKTRKARTKEDLPTINMILAKFDGKNGNRIFYTQNSVSNHYDADIKNKNRATPLQILYLSILSNGNILVIKQKYEKRIVTFQSPNGGVNSVTYYDFGDIIVNCFNVAGKQLYSSKIKRTCTSVETKYPFMPKIMERDGHVAVLFNELDAATTYFTSGSTKSMKTSELMVNWTMKKTQLVSVVVDNTGKVDKRTVLRDNDGTEDYFDLYNDDFGFSYTTNTTQQSLVGLVMPLPKMMQFKKNAIPKGAFEIQF